MNEALLRLAAAAGIEHGYWDGLGVWRGLAEPAATALLTALGFDPTRDFDVQVRSLEDAAYTRPLPAALVVRSETALTLSLALALESREQTIPWQLTLESGERHCGEFLPAQLTDERESGGVKYGRFSLTIDRLVPTGYHRFELVSLGCATALIVVPARCFIQEELAAGRRVWGLAVQLYTLRSARNWGIGDFTDLARLASMAGRTGAALIGLNPLHARHLARPGEASPYAPSSRLFLDVLYLDVEAIADYALCDAAISAVTDPAFQLRLAAAREAPLVNYAAVAGLKLPILELMYRRFRVFLADPAHAEDQRGRSFRAFIERGGEALARCVEFDAVSLTLQESTGSLPGWREWPPELRDPANPALARLLEGAAERIGFLNYLQWQAALQLEFAAVAARNAGMAIGLYRDLAVGPADDGAATWSDQELIASGVSVGAPPDMLNRQGQNWGTPPWNPRVLERREFRPFAALLAANMQCAGALRIDHVMALTRLFWIPAGMKGADGDYVRNPLESLAGIVALESERNRCMVIGEDLGAVPDGLRERLHELGFLSYRVQIFERHWQGDGSFKRPWEYPAQALATVATHDMPTIAEYWRGGDIGRRAALGLYPEPGMREQEEARRAAERPGILALLGELGLSPADTSDTGQITEALHTAIAKTNSMLAVVQLDDLLGEVEPVNIPGTYLEYPNWRRKLSRSIEEIEGDPRLARLAEIMRNAGRA